MPSHGNGPTFSHQLNLLPLPSNVPAQGLPGMLHYGNWGTFSPTSENSSRANPLVPSMMGLSCLFLAEYQVCSQSLYQSFLTMGLVLLVLCPHMGVWCFWSSDQSSSIISFSILMISQYSSLWLRWDFREGMQLVFKAHQVQNPTCALDLQARPVLHGRLWHATKGPRVIFHFFISFRF